ncbi:MAG: helix-turn-helix transcriptional regulator [Candidatus Methanoperedens sp.]|nr:helix-turn-helix transcriptional regulator [Candidatus Methanoperedens sp.]MCE8428546.1 helix-turn-helix transcriptional regulator [Candidatus Methanoperedens sp.]
MGQILNDLRLIPKFANNPGLKSDIPVEDIVKNHLEIIILSLLLEKPRCGYDLIKEIIARYNVMISQGTVYPLLYSLKREGIIHMESMKGDMKIKNYSITGDFRYTVEKKIDGFIKTEEYILNSIRNGEIYV